MTSRQVECGFIHSVKNRKSSTPLIWFHHTDAGVRGTLKKVFPGICIGYVLHAGGGGGEASADIEDTENLVA